jgi:hypothetical protein
MNQHARDFDIEPRGLTLEQAMRYVGCKSEAAFRSRIKRGKLPHAMPGTHAWDRKAIDAMLDQASGLAASVTPANAFDQWIASRGDHT